MKAYTDRDGKCSSCRHLYGLGTECLIITLTVLHVLMTTCEILIHLEVIQVPSTASGDDVAVATTVASLETTAAASSTYDPGGPECDPDNIHRNLLLTVQVFRYATMTVSGLFLIEIFCKAVYLRKEFFKDTWQLFDTLVVMLSLGVEVSYFVLHTELYCYHRATEAAAYVIILRLWRIPRACNVRKEQYCSKYDNAMKYLMQTKEDAEQKYSRLEERYLTQEQENKKLKELLVQHGVLAEAADKLPNGAGPQNSAITEAARRVMSASGRVNSATINNEVTDSVRSSNGIIIGPTSVQYTRGTSSAPLLDNDELDKDTNSEHEKKLHSELERNDSDVNSRANDSGIEAKDSFRSDSREVAASVKTYPDNDDVFDESDSSELNGRSRETNVQEVKAQIEETSRQNQLPSIRSVEEDNEVAKVVMRRKPSDRHQGGFINSGYDGDGEDMDGTSTYKSADGIPMTDL